MSGVEYLLDTNSVLGVLREDETVFNILRKYNIASRHCAYSPITRIELLGFPNMNSKEEYLILQLLKDMTKLHLVVDVEDIAIDMKRQHRIKLPDAVILATALHHRLQLLTFDKDLAKIFKNKKH